MPHNKKNVILNIENCKILHDNEISDFIVLELIKKSKFKETTTISLNIYEVDCSTYNIKSVCSDISFLNNRFINEVKKKIIKSEDQKIKDLYSYNFGDINNNLLIIRYNDIKLSNIFNQDQDFVKGNSPFFSEFDDIYEWYPSFSAEQFIDHLIFWKNFWLLSKSKWNQTYFIFSFQKNKLNSDNIIKNENFKKFIIDKLGYPEKNFVSKVKNSDDLKSKLKQLKDKSAQIIFIFAHYDNKSLIQFLYQDEPIDIDAEYFISIIAELKIITILIICNFYNFIVKEKNISLIQKKNLYILSQASTINIGQVENLIIRLLKKKKLNITSDIDKLKNYKEIIIIENIIDNKLEENLNHLEIKVNKIPIKIESENELKRIDYTSNDSEQFIKAINKIRDNLLSDNIILFSNNPDKLKFVSENIAIESKGFYVINEN